MQIDTPRALEVLRDGEIEIVGRLLGSSNHAMLCRVRLPCPEPAESIDRRGRLQADRRRAAARRLPRRDAVPSRGRRVPRQRGDRLGDRPADDPPRRAVRRRRRSSSGSTSTRRSTSSRWSSRTIRRLRRIAVFDAAVNNTDRKGGHLLPVAGGHVYGVDHGVTFSTVPKLRTVLWGWRGRPFAADERAGLARLADALRGDLARDLAGLLSRAEIAATRRRVDALLETRPLPPAARRTGRRSPGRRSDGRG